MTAEENCSRGMSREITWIFSGWSVHKRVLTATLQGVVTPAIGRQRWHVPKNRPPG